MTNIACKNIQRTAGQPSDAGLVLAGLICAATATEVKDNNPDSPFSLENTSANPVWHGKPPRIVWPE